jgi:serine/threonine protein kinase
VSKNDITESLSTVTSIKKHQIPFENIEVEKELGKGSYGKVCLGRWNDTPVALKFCKEKEGLDDFLKEANLMMYRTQKRERENQKMDNLFYIARSISCIVQFFPKSSLDLILESCRHILMLFKCSEFQLMDLNQFL